MCPALAEHRWEVRSSSSRTLTPWFRGSADCHLHPCRGHALPCRWSSVAQPHGRMFSSNFSLCTSCPTHPDHRVCCISHCSTPQPPTPRRDQRTHPLRTTMKSMTFQPLRRYEPLWKMNPRATILIPASKQKIPMK